MEIIIDRQGSFHLIFITQQGLCSINTQGEFIMSEIIVDTTAGKVRGAKEKGLLTRG